EQVWMAENLKFDAPYSLCYDKIEGFCDKFGRFYSLHIDGEYFGLFDETLVDTICPAGWHVPSLDEWGLLASKAGNAARLMSISEFGELYEPGTDDCGFNSLPAGNWLMNGELSSYGRSSSYWTSTSVDFNFSYALHLSLFERFNFANRNSPKMSIRCIKDSL
ncbi:MAG: hypothetical protein HUK20_10475, partial [Fibrobacter sp.]|nr:hypothetical protein [Fibrobacter sp.]